MFYLRNGGPSSRARFESLSGWCGNEQRLSDTEVETGVRLLTRFVRSLRRYGSHCHPRNGAGFCDTCGLTGTCTATGLLRQSVLKLNLKSQAAGFGSMPGESPHITRKKKQGLCAIASAEPVI